MVVAVAASVVAAVPGVGVVVTRNQGFARRPPAPRSIGQAGVCVQLAGVASGVAALAEWAQGLLARYGRRLVNAVPSLGRSSRGAKQAVPSGW